MITFSPINQRYILLLHSLKQHPAYLHNQSEFKFNYYSRCSKCPFSFTHAWSFFLHLSIASSTMLCDKLCHMSIKRRLTSVTSRTGVRYTWACIMPHIWQSTGLRSWLFGDQKSGGMNSGVSRWMSLMIWRARCAGALSCRVQQLMFLKVV